MKVSLNCQPVKAYRPLFKGGKNEIDTKRAGTIRPHCVRGKEPLTSNKSNVY